MREVECSEVGEVNGICCFATSRVRFGPCGDWSKLSRISSFDCVFIIPSAPAVVLSALAEFCGVTVNHLKRRQRGRISRTAAEERVTTVQVSLEPVLDLAEAGFNAA